MIRYLQFNKVGLNPIFLILSFTFLAGCATTKNNRTEEQSGSSTPLQYKNKSEIDQLYKKKIKELSGLDWKETNCDFKVDYIEDSLCTHVKVLKRNKMLWIKCVPLSDDSYPFTARGKCAKRICKESSGNQACTVTEGPQEVFAK